MHNKLEKGHIYVPLTKGLPTIFISCFCCLINTMKSEIGIVSKKILNKINNNIRSKTNLVQWKNSFEVIDWLNKIKNKKTLNFFKFNIEKFYPSITSKELSNALKIAKSYTKVSPLDKIIIIHSCRSVLSESNGAE